ncbi:hypothetical protein DFH28DRAFT_907618 [Melampsora americana]|nr:hypothetical protein DFH28DRAFT_907618 [Melampsora americana]
MVFNFDSRLPLRFNSIFWTKHEITSANSDPACRFRYFETNVIVHQNNNTIQGISLNIATRKDQSEIRNCHAYRIDGQVGVGSTANTPMLTEDATHTIAIDHAEVRLNCMANKVLAQGLGQIVDRSRRRAPGKPVEVIKVLHRCWNATHTHRVDFYANYLLDTNLASSLTTANANALATGNIISLRGNVVSITMDNTWEIQVSSTLSVKMQ